MEKFIGGLAGLLFGMSAVAAPAPNTNIIYLIGDGMGGAYTSAFRYYSNQSTTQVVDKTIFDEMLVGMASTYPHDDELNITDSAAAGTALSSGIKTFDGAIGVDKQHHPVKTLLDKAREQGYNTGVAVTSHLNDATPAAFLGHADERHSYDKLADQYLDIRIANKPRVDVLLGGGAQYFVRQDRNLAQEFSALGYHYITDLKQLPSITTLPVLGLFSPVGMTSALDSDHPLRLAEMTEKSLQLLQAKPFFLMLEASQIDWCGHANDIACAMAEMSDMAATMKVIKKFIDQHPNTIFVATADHSTGGLSIGANGIYKWDVRTIKNIKATAVAIANKLQANKANWRADWQALTGISLTPQEQQAMDTLLANTSAASEKSAEFSESLLKENTSKVQVQVVAYINKYTYTGWTTRGHTGEDVQIFAYGKNSSNFAGAMDNTDIAKKLMGYLSQPQ